MSPVTAPTENLNMLGKDHDAAVALILHGWHNYDIATRSRCRQFELSRWRICEDNRL